MTNVSKAFIGQLSADLKAEALRLGFSACGISQAVFLDREASRLEAWLNGGNHATMGWMANHFDKRTDPRRLVDGAKSVVSVLHNYYQPVEPPGETRTGRISRYAWGDDYHTVMKTKLFELFDWIETQFGSVGGRAFVDSAPVMDKVWAERSGLGWIGKHSNLINRSIGSYFFIGELILDIELQPDSPIADYCGSCTSCIDACPTEAIHPEGFVEAGRCISYLTIEHREDDIPENLQPEMGRWIFGCDICQDVCPWNKFKKPTKESRYLPRKEIPHTSLLDWQEIDLESFRRVFKNNPVKRTKYQGFKRNVRIALKNSAAE